MVLAVVIGVALMLGRPASVLGLALVGDRCHAVIVEEAARRRRIVQGDLASCTVQSVILRPSVNTHGCSQKGQCED